MLFDEVTGRIEEELQTRKFSKIAMLTVWAQYNPRIFERGQNSYGDQIGDYVDGPYKKLRRERGRTIAFVNLEFTGMMRKNYQPKAEPVLGFYFSSQEEINKADGNEARYGLVFDLTNGEAELFTETLAKLLFP